MSFTDKIGEFSIVNKQKVDVKLSSEARVKKAQPLPQVVPTRKPLTTKHSTDKKFRLT